MVDEAVGAEGGSGQMQSVKPAAVLRRLPGKARARTDALQEYEDLNAERRKRIPSVLWDFWAPSAEELYRWRVQLDCNCITEVLTWRDKDVPGDRQWFDPVNMARLPAGQMLCHHEDSPPAQYQDIVTWGDRREVSFPADPVEPPEWADGETWAVVRRGEPHTAAFWKVTLSCGHVTEVVAPSLDWKPADGPRRTSAKRIQEMRAEYDEFWAATPDGQSEHERDHTKRLLAEGWPSPAPEQLCSTCPHARLIVTYERVGWLVPRKPEPKVPKPPSRAGLERRLRQAEAEAARLRGELARLDDQGATADG